MNAVHHSETLRAKAEREFNNHLDSIGWTMTGEYRGLVYPVEVMCPQGHAFEVRRSRFNGVCHTCHPRQTTSQRDRYYAF